MKNISELPTESFMQVGLDVSETLPSVDIDIMSVSMSWIVRSIWVVPRK